MGINADIPGLYITGCVFCGILAVIHIYIFILEAILWRKRAAKTFRLPQSTVDVGASLAANQGFYNLLLAVGLIWGLAKLNAEILLFFLAAIFTAGIFGVVTVSTRILFVQVIPALLGFIFVDFGYFSKTNWSHWNHSLYLLLILIGAGLVTAILSFIIKKYFLGNISSPSSQSPSVGDNL
jgi:putative membrane protein